MVNLRKFKEIVNSLNDRLAQIPEKITDRKLSEENWTLKEIIGHLIDSSANNHQRFVRLQFGDLLDFPAYKGEEWVKVQGYAGMKWKDIITLWYSYNCILLEVIENIKQDSLQNVWVKGEDALPLEFLINDYYQHMEWHIDHFNRRLKEVSGG
ncbi:MAG: hypothetical protein ACYDG2_02350 [Ruminiclostridium sp.]